MFLKSKILCTIPLFRRQSSKIMQISSQPSPNFKTEEIHVRLIEDDKDSMFISYILNGENSKMIRPRYELMEKTLQRLVVSYTKKLQKGKGQKSNSGKNQKKQPIETEKATVVVTCDGVAFNTNKIQNNDFKTGMTVAFGETLLSVVFNAPEVTALHTFPRTLLLVGCPIVPHASVDYSDGYTCVWCVETAPRSGEYVVASNDQIFTPTSSAVGCRLKVYCTPFKTVNGSPIGEPLQTGRSTVFYLSGAVEAASPVMNRINDIRMEFNSIPRNTDEIATTDKLVDGSAKSTEHRNRDELRVVTFNILAEPFATSAYAVSSMFRYCAPAHLETEYRIQRILLEIRAHDADVICLQECDRKCFDLYLRPLLLLDGYVGHYTNKVSMVMEGCATFTRNSTCSVLRRIDVPLKNVLRDASYMKGVYAARPDLRDILGGKLGTVGQITVCQSTHRPDRVLVVANTHLFYHPLANYLRVLQMDAILKCVNSLLRGIRHKGLRHHMRVAGEELQDGDVEENVGVDEVNEKLSQIGRLDGTKAPAITPCAILLGDLNSCPHTGLVQYMTSGAVSDDRVAEEWNELQKFCWGKGEAVAVDPSTTAESSESPSVPSGQFVDPASLPVLKHGLRLVSAAGFPQFTNYTAEFRNLLDYIFVEDNRFEVRRVAPFPSEDVLSEHTGLPSAVFPSDHIAVAVDLRFR